MIPIKLTIKGMYSYREEQTVDFSALTKNHLFGIFGPVGSGKSTILEAMSFALYGETERLNMHDGRSYNMMNLKSNALTIDFTFRSGEKNKDLYLFTVRGKRDKKDFTKVAKLDRKAYIHDGTDWTPLETTDGAKIIGLKYDNFRRTIIIPQGKFQEFLQLGDADRTTMMKEIFNLSRYDLARRTELLDKANATQLSTVQGQLMQVGEVDEAGIADKERTRDALIAARTVKEHAIAEEENREKEMQSSKALLAKVEDAERALTGLRKDETNYRERKKVVEEYERCRQQFPDTIKQRTDAQNDLRTSDSRLAQHRATLATCEAGLAAAEHKFDIARTEYDQRQTLQNRWTELESIAEILKVDKEIGTMTGSMNGLDQDIQARTKAITELRALIKSQEADAKSAKAEMPDKTVLMEVKQWAATRANIQVDIAAVKKFLGELENAVVTMHTTAADRTLPLGNLITLLEGAVASCQEAIDVKGSESESLKQSEVLEKFASALTEETPCPLCGSMDHPHIYASKGVEAMIVQLTADKKELGRQVSALQSCLQKLSELSGKFDAAAHAKSRTETELRAKQNALHAHEAGYVWERILLDTVDGEIVRADALKKRIATLEAHLETNRAGIETQETAATKLKESFQEQQRAISALTGKRKGLSEALRHFRDEDIAVWTTATIEREIFDLKERYKKVESAYTSLDKDIRTGKEQRSALLGSITAELTSHESITARLQQVNDQLKQRLEASGFSDVAEVEKILRLGIDVEKEEHVLQAYFQSVASAEDLLKTRTTEARGAVYDEAAHEGLKAAIVEARRELGRDNEDIGRLNTLIAELAKKFTEKKKLSAEKELLEVRAANLGTLKLLFRGSGFVNYASRIYLQNLCGIANQRFTQLTRQKLRLELNADNSFEVRDFLNDGKLRSVKTLSGGQTFQAALSLALGLADSLQQLTRTEENFFFLDEGFGSLDKESLQVVFDALKSLRKDNRVVGVISHVEEMQQEIVNYVAAHLDPEAGTVLECT
jgi:exonuclease SbcC